MVHFRGGGVAGGWWRRDHPAQPARQQVRVDPRRSRVSKLNVFRQKTRHVARHISTKQRDQSLTIWRTWSTSSRTRGYDDGRAAPHDEARSASGPPPSRSSGSTSIWGRSSCAFGPASALFRIASPASTVGPPIQLARICLPSSFASGFNFSAVADFGHVEQFLDSVHAQDAYATENGVEYFIAACERTSVREPVCEAAAFAAASVLIRLSQPQMVASDLSSTLSCP